METRELSETGIHMPQVEGLWVSSSSSQGQIGEDREELESVLTERQHWSSLKGYIQRHTRTLTLRPIWYIRPMEQADGLQSILLICSYLPIQTPSFLHSLSTVQTTAIFSCILQNIVKPLHTTLSIVQPREEPATLGLSNKQFVTGF